MAKYENIHELNTQEVTQTWNKLHNTATKAGFRDGVTIGRDSVFQNSFNAGYSEGFKMGFELGKREGSLRAKIQNPQTSSTAVTTDSTVEDVCFISSSKSTAPKA